MSIPKIVVLCGSSRFVDVMAVCAWLIERDEGAISMGLHLLPGWHPDCPAHHLAEHEGVADAMDTLHLRKIDIAHEIFVVNVNGYIGESTSREIAYAIALGKTVRYFGSDPVGIKVMEMARLARDAGGMREIPPPARKADYVGKRVLVRADPPALNEYVPQKYPLQSGMVAMIERRMNAMETRNSPMDVANWGSIRVLRLRWVCPTCGSWHTGFVPEAWIEERNLVFVESDGGSV